MRPRMMRPDMKRAAGVAAIAATLVFGVSPRVAAAGEDDTYAKPSPAVAAAIEASVRPQAVVSPSRTVVAVVKQNTMPSIAEMAQPLLRLAGQRINPATNNIHFNYRSPSIAAITLTTIATGAAIDVPLPAEKEGAFYAFHFSPDGSRIALTRAVAGGSELWLIDVATGTPKKLTGPVLNGTFGDACDWRDDGTSLVCRTIAATRGPVPQAPAVPAGPKVQQHSGVAAPVRTNQDLLSSPYDEALFEYYFTSQLAAIDAATGQVTPLGEPGIYAEVSPSPDGQYVLVNRIKRPFSRLVTTREFAQDVLVLDAKGSVARKIGELPLAETVPIEGVTVGPRAAAWQPGSPATVTWVEALDGGNPATQVPHRDKLLSLAAPFSGSPAELIKTEYRFQSVSWTDKGLGFVAESDRGKRWTRTWLVTTTAGAVAGAPKKVFDRSSEDRYTDPGAFVRRPSGVPTAEFGPSPDRVVLQSGQAVYLAGEGASPVGDRPFLDRLDLTTLKTERLFQCGDKVYESIVAVLSDDGQAFLTRKETPTTPANVLAYDAGTKKPARALTKFTDPVPDLSAAQKQLLTYERKDGVKLSAILYVPKTRKGDERLPMILWAYPREFTAANAASQVIGSPYRYNVVDFGTLYLGLLLEGYAVIVPTMPIVGSGETANDTYVEQLVASAEAAVDKAVAVGVADRDRIGVAGHSYGAFMTANLLAHSDLFKAGIALSGAYNRTLTPFGFQNERRTFWDKPDLYARMSPFWYAHKVKEPILLLHGEVDNNQGTFPIQSERFYMALKGHGATVRYEVLPHESHRYAARETLNHVAAEYVTWFDKYVKNASAAPRTTATSEPR